MLQDKAAGIILELKPEVSEKVKKRLTYTVYRRLIYLGCAVACDSGCAVR